MIRERHRSCDTQSQCSNAICRVTRQSTALGGCWKLRRMPPPRLRFSEERNQELLAERTAQFCEKKREWKWIHYRGSYPDFPQHNLNFNEPEFPVNDRRKLFGPGHLIEETYASSLMNLDFLDETCMHGKPGLTGRNWHEKLTSGSGAD